MASGDAEGYWGNVTSTVDWCEANYTETPFIAEFWNTISSSTMLLLGLAGLFYHWRLGKSLALAFFCVFVVGVGSIAFHGTLKHEYQLLDELPMTYANLALTYCLLEDQRERKYSNLFPIGLVVFGVIFSVLLTLLADVSAFWTSELFRWTFLIHETAIVIRIGWSYTRAESVTVKRLFGVGIILYAIGFVLWLLDLNFCGTFQALPVNPQFHAIWHVLAGTGSYLLLLVVAYYRTERVHQIDPALKFGLGFIPHIGAKTVGRVRVPESSDTTIEPHADSVNGVEIHTTTAVPRSPIREETV